jgi:AraC-like DNA-binding protein
MNRTVVSAWFRYLPVTPEALRWGFYVLDAGYTLIPPGTPYPPGKHPEDHDFTWEEGRTLPSYTLVYITRGAGRFESATAGPLRIEAGDLFILFPGEWHRYRPDPATGWDEYWVEFDGDHARRIMEHRDFSKAGPVICAGHDEALLRLFLDLNESIRDSPLGFEHIIATQAAQMVARVLAAGRRRRGDDGSEEKLVRRACFHILEQLDRNIDFAALASDLGLSYSGFRKKFRRVTGLPPGRYQQQIRLNHACRLLQQSHSSITEIAERLGFENIFYFSRLFKRKTGMSPRDYRGSGAGKGESLQAPRE